MDAAEFSALDCKVAAQLDLPCTLIGGVFSTHPIKRHISRVSRPIKLPNTLIVSPIRDRILYNACPIADLRSDFAGVSTSDLILLLQIALDVI
jgi:hypothetical protein